MCSAIGKRVCLQSLSLAVPALPLSAAGLAEGGFSRFRREEAAASPPFRLDGQQLSGTALEKRNFILDPSWGRREWKDVQEWKN